MMYLPQLRAPQVTQTQTLSAAPHSPHSRGAPGSLSPGQLTAPATPPDTPPAPAGARVLQSEPSQGELMEFGRSLSQSGHK